MLYIYCESKFLGFFRRRAELSITAQKIREFLSQYNGKGVIRQRGIIQSQMHLSVSGKYDSKNIFLPHH